jgi:hypothetical protein
MEPLRISGNSQKCDTWMPLEAEGSFVLTMGSLCCTPGIAVSQRTPKELLQLPSKSSTSFDDILARSAGECQQGATHMHTHFLSVETWMCCLRPISSKRVSLTKLDMIRFVDLAIIYSYLQGRSTAQLKQDANAFETDRKEWGSQAVFRRGKVDAGTW